jgi:hypothetical protein
MAVAHRLRSTLPGAFPSTTPPRLFDRLSYRLKRSQSRTRRSRSSASPSLRRQRSGRRATATCDAKAKNLSLAGKLRDAGQQEHDACRQHDDAQEMGDHWFDSSTRALISPKRTPRIALASQSSAFARQIGPLTEAAVCGTTLHRSWIWPSAPSGKRRASEADR